MPNNKDMSDLLLFIRGLTGAEQTMIIADKIIEPYPPKRAYQISNSEKSIARLRRVSKGKEKRKLKEQYLYTLNKIKQDEGYIKKTYNSNIRKIAKRQSNKQIRQYRAPIDNGSFYRKITDYKNNIW